MNIYQLMNAINIRRFIRSYNDIEINSFIDLLDNINCNVVDRKNLLQIFIKIPPSVIERIYFGCEMIIGIYRPSIKIVESAEFIQKIIKFG